MKALYPSIPIEDAVEVVCQKFIEKKIELVDVDYEELGLYLALTMEPDELADARINDVCPTRANNGRRPEITASGVKVQKVDPLGGKWSHNKLLAMQVLHKPFLAKYRSGHFWPSIFLNNVQTGQRQFTTNYST